MLHSIALLILLRFFSLAEGGQLTNCSRVYSCGGTVQAVGYPFRGDDRPPACGRPEFELRCSTNNLTTIDIAGESFAVREIGRRSMRIARADLLNGFCVERYEDTRLAGGNGYPELRYSANVTYLKLFYPCPDFNISETARQRFNCGSNGAEGVGYIVDEWTQAPIGCAVNVTIPVMRSGTTTFAEVVNEGFEVEYETDGDGACTVCESSGSRHTGNDVNVGRKIWIGAGAAAFGAVIMCILFFAYHRRYKRRHAIPFPSVESNVSSLCPLAKEDLEKAGIHIFDYQELEEATNHFDPKREVGDGGYGAVYKGKLRDGRTVAVKRLYENHYRRVEQFMNEVKILARLRHQNLVSLYGCTSTRDRELLLVYEYVSNGTLADQLHGAHPGSLPWVTRLNIAVEIASALAYLHTSGVIHRDIKSSNILLDANFGVKVADLGLSRLHQSGATHVSTAPQGTPGYVDPEYHEFYQLSEKSDVYSFGVVLMELISSQPAIDITRHRHEINLSTMAINKIQGGALAELVDPCLWDCGGVKRAVIAVAEVAFQCVQSEKEMRPEMQHALEALQEIQKNMTTTDQNSDHVLPFNAS